MPRQNENDKDVQTSDTFDLIETMERLAGGNVFDASDEGATPVLVLPRDKTVVSLKGFIDEFREKPRRRQGTATLRDTASFIEHVNRFKLPRSAIFVLPDPAAPKFVAVYDYHAAQTETTDADWLGHRAEYAPQLSDAWKVWAGKNNQPLNQADFAAFIEQNITDIIVPKLDDPEQQYLKALAALVEGTWANPSDMVRLSRGLQVNVESVVKNAQTLSSGEVSIIYEEVHKDGAGSPLKIPTLFTIGVPVFFNGATYRVAARLRYRVASAKIMWSYQLVRPELVFQDALNGMVESVRKETGAFVVLGSPEK